MSAENVSPIIFDVWLDGLNEWSDGLDLSDPEGRADFRVIVGNKTRGTRVEVLREVAGLLGATKVPTSTGGAQRALADAFIAFRLELLASVARMRSAR